jgi:hypothetical protein
VKEEIKKKKKNKEVQAAKFFLIVLDEMLDVQCKYQISKGLRYLRDSKICERFS